MSANKDIRTFIFNSKQLLPWEIAKKMVEGDMESAIKWCEEQQQDHRFAPNDEVADKMAPGHKMVVKEIRYQTYRVTPDGNERKGRIIGIECYWWVDLDQIKSDKDYE